MGAHKRITIPKDNNQVLARIWPDFVCLEKRMKKEVPFILKNRSNNSHCVFDAALGSGATTIGLMRAGIRSIVSNEIDPAMVSVAHIEARERGYRLMTLGRDWADLCAIVTNHFELVTCLGNSLTCVLDSRKRLQVLKSFAEMMEQSGVLIIDERNYSRMLAGDFSHSGKYVYCGVDKVSCTPAHIDNELVVMQYTHRETGETAYLEMYPFKRGELRSLLEQAGFSDIKTFGDYKEDFDPDNVEFFTYVARK
jgi:hypothetical protein